MARRGTSHQLTQYGDCGGVLIGVTNSGPVLLGLHGYGNAAKHIFALPITPNEVDVESGCRIPYSSTSAQRELASLHKKSVMRYMEEGVADVYGSFAGFKVSHKSNVKKSIFHDKMKADGYVCEFTKPVMSGWRPWNIAAKDMVRPISFKQDLIDEVKKDLLETIKSRLCPNQLNLLEPYDTFTAVNGAAGVSYVDKLNRNTSAGNPWKKSKRYFLSSIPPESGLQDPVEVVEEMKNRIEEIEDIYGRGQRYHPNFCGNLKDEAVSFAKAESGKTRVFTGSPMDWTIVVRKYFLSCIRCIQNNKFAFETAVGTVSQSTEWGEVYKYVTKHGKSRIIAGDYKSFDKRMSAQLILAAFDILIDLCETSGNYTAKQLRAMRCIAEDTAFPLIDFNGDLVQFYGSNPSGHPLTVIINSLVNSMYVRIGYKHVIGDVSSFRDNVSLLTYGDDNIMSVSLLKKEFNHTSLAEALYTYGIIYTMADKEAESIPFIDIKDADFLKRKWRYDTDVGAFVAPLDETSIIKSLMMIVQSKTISDEEQMISIVSSAVREYFFHGKDKFQEMSAVLKLYVRSHSLQFWVQDSTFPTWDQLYEEFWESSKMLLATRLDLKAQAEDIHIDNYDLEEFERMVLAENELEDDTDQEIEIEAVTIGPAVTSPTAIQSFSCSCCFGLSSPSLINDVREICSVSLEIGMTLKRYRCDSGNMWHVFCPIIDDIPPLLWGIDQHILRQNFNKIVRYKNELGICLYVIPFLSVVYYIEVDEFSQNACCGRDHNGFIDVPNGAFGEYVL